MTSGKHSVAGAANSSGVISSTSTLLCILQYTMPAPVYEHISVHRSARSIEGSVLEKLFSNDKETNIVLVHFQKVLTSEEIGQPMTGQLWLVSMSLILSCTVGPMGTHPIFIAPLQPEMPAPQILDDVIERLAHELRKVVSTRRVFSVFGPDLVTKKFVDVWYRLTGIPFYQQPYYAAKLTYVTLDTLKSRPKATILEFECDLRLAVETDIPQVASLCYGFAQKSEPFVLSKEKSMQEAMLITREQQCWVHTVTRPGEPPQVACIVVVGRDGGSVAAVTKVYTDPKWRRRGCAERLLRRVCKVLLASREAVVLFVAHDNSAANGVYHRVGFAGLEPNAGPVQGVNSWLEIGFDQTFVDLGHW